MAKAQLFIDYQIELPAHTRLSLLLEATPLPHDVSPRAKAFAPHLDLVREGRVLARADDVAEGISQVEISLEEPGTMRCVSRDASRRASASTSSQPR